METQRIMVTGGSGFIGTNLVNELRSRGHEVLSVDLLHHEDEADLYSDSYSDYVRGDIRNYRQMERIFDDNEKFRNFIYEIRGENKSLPLYAKGTACVVSALRSNKKSNIS